jgi:hypothetical protein
MYLANPIQYHHTPQYLNSSVLSNYYDICILPVMKGRCSDVVLNDTLLEIHHHTMLAEQHLTRPSWNMYLLHFGLALMDDPT